MICIKRESDVLDQETRFKIIQSFDTDKNKRRKDEAFKAYECLKDETVHYVMDLLLKQFSESTVTEMQYSMTNISILRKVIEKLAKVYGNGVKRTMDTDADTAAIEKMAEYLKLTPAMKKTNRYFRTFKNCLVYVRPMKNEDKYDIVLEVKPPFHYDVVEDPDNSERAMAVILSDYVASRRTLYTLGDAAYAGRERNGNVRVVQETMAQLVQTNQTGYGESGGKDSSAREGELIWWTKNFHFTTNYKGELIDKQEIQGEFGIDNPISTLPFVNFCGDQDGCFYAKGGKDLVDTGVKINVMLTNAQHIGVSQGYGQLYMTGKDLPKQIKVGPNNCVQLEQADKDDPTPTIGYLNSNPPLADLKTQIEMLVALMLTTNNLSTSGFSTSLQGGTSFASGVALLIDKSESIEDIQEQSQIFIDQEPKVLQIAAEWWKLYSAARMLTDEALSFTPPKNPEKEQVNFPTIKPVLSESEHLDILKKRQGLGINTPEEILMLDNPSLTEAEATIKLAKIREEKMANAEAFGLPVGGNNGNQSESSGGVVEQDSLDTGPSVGSETPESGEGSDQG